MRKKKKLFPQQRVCVVPVAGMTLSDIPTVFKEFADHIVEKRELTKLWILTLSDKSSFSVNNIYL